LYDSEGSNSSFVTLPNSEPNGEVSEISANPDTVMDVDNGVNINNGDSHSCSKVNTLVMESLNELASFYDNISFIDSHLDVPDVDIEGPCSSSSFDWSPGYLLSGQTDDSPTCDIQDLVRNHCAKDIISCLSVDNMKRSQARLKCVVNSVQMLDEDSRRKAQEVISIGINDTTKRLHIANIDFPSRYVKSFHNVNIRKNNKL
jgi:hypothetical protein